jgi:hypothetical protein
VAKNRKIIMQIRHRIPKSLDKQLASYTKFLFTSETFIAIGVAISVVLISFFLLFASDRIWDTPKILRILFSLTGFAVVLCFLFWFGKNWIWKKRGIKQIATNIQSKHRELGDRLLGAIELAQEGHSDEHISEELRLAAIMKVTEQAAKIDFNKDINKKKPIQALIVMILLCGLGFLLFSLLPQAFHNAFIRWCNPVASISRYTFIVFEKMPNRMKVPKGEPFEITLRLASESRWMPKKLFYQIPGITKGEADFNKNTATINLEGLNSPATMEVHSGDTSDTLTIDPVHRPSLIEFISQVKLPKYTGRGETKSILKNGDFTLLKGSTYSLKGNVSRNLASAKYTSEGKDSDLKTTNSIFSTRKIIAEKNRKYTFTWQDIFGFSPAVPYDLSLKIKNDREPFSECPGLPHFSAILIDEAMKINLKADDDFGVKDIAAAYSIGTSNGKKVKHLETKVIPLALGGKDKIELKTNTLFSPDLLGIPEKSLVTFYALATDYYPGRKAAKSVPYRIYILSKEQHMKLIQRRLKRIMSDLEDMIRREDASLTKNSKLSKLSEKEMKKTPTSEKIKEQKLREDAERREAKKMVEETIKLLKEALRNKKIPEKTIAQWAEFLEKMRNLSKQEMKNIVSKLQQAAAKKNPKKNMADAVKNQQKLLDKLKNILKKMDKSMDSLALDNFVNRLKKAAAKEHGISRTLKKMLPEIIGLPIEQITDVAKQDINQQIDIQKHINQNAEYIRDDLLAFFSRTRIEKYKKVTDDMEKVKMDAKLRKLQKNIEENYTARCINQSKRMADKFDEWAGLLRKSDNKKANGEGQGKPQKIDPEFMLGLLRIIQGEQNLREKTRYLDKNKPEQTQYKENAGLLSGDQGEVHLKLMFLTRKAQKSPPALKLLKKAGLAMDDVVTYLRKPQTDGPVIAAETEIIELLSGAFQHSSKQAGSSSAMMAMMMQMLMQGAAAGQSGTGSTMGGNTDVANMKFNDPAFKKDDPSHTTDKTHGTDTAEIPEEYKNVIEAYFKKRSKIKQGRKNN